MTISDGKQSFTHPAQFVEGFSSTRTPLTGKIPGFSVALALQCDEFTFAFVSMDQLFMVSNLSSGTKTRRQCLGLTGPHSEPG
jgi:hypothetical protein